MYFVRFNFIFFIIWAWLFKLTKTYNYCGDEQEKKLCKHKQHFICHPDTVPQDGKFIALAPMTKKMKRTFLEGHNRCRDKLASGEQEYAGGGKFPKATRMREVLWDDELAYIAGQHAKRCNMEHDKCRSTDRFSMAGQNLYIMSSSKKLTNMTKLVENAINSWWGESSLVTDGLKLADNFPDGVEDWHKVGHFTAMANERNAFVGCGVALCENCNGMSSCVEITCDYSSTNIEQAFMYKKGDAAASECGFYESSPSETNRHLCVNTGKIFDDV